MNDQEKFYNKIYTDPTGENYITLFLARSQEGEEPVVIFYNVSLKSQVLYLPMGKFLDSYTHYDPYQASRMIVESELGRETQNNFEPSEVKTNKKPKRVKNEDIARVLEDELKDIYEPLKSEDLYFIVMENAEFRSSDLKLPNFRNNILPKICTINPRIKKTGPGLYQYIDEE